jgi:hypothetical protein
MRTNLNTGDADLELLNFIGSPVSPANSVEYESLLVSYASQRFDCKITANEPYTVTKIDTGDGTGWITISRGNESSTNYLIFAVEESTVDRSMDIEVVIGADTFLITITQQNL